jgi:predicted DNA-binding antitoxin AbrB/MazE fold protein
MNANLAMIEPTDSGVIEDLSKVVIRDGEKRLMLAILESATEDFQKYILSNNKRRKELFQQAEEWILDTDDHSFFSFENVCEHLQLNPGYMRQGFMRWKEAKLKDPAKTCTRRSNRRAA